MTTNDKIHAKYRRGVIEVHIDRNGVIETKDNCTLTINPTELRQNAIIVTIGCVFMMIFAFATWGSALKEMAQDGMSLAATLAMIFILLLWCGGLVYEIRSSWRFIAEPHPPIVLTKKGIALPNQNEVLWEDIEVIYFTINSKYVFQAIPSHN